VSGEFEGDEAKKARSSGTRMNTSQFSRRSGATEVIRTVLDDRTVERLRDGADARGIEVEQLIVQLVVAASQRIDDLLGPPE
jgi:hypothetical protein